MREFLEKIREKILTLSQQDPKFFKSREMSTPPNDEVSHASRWPVMDSLACPACQSRGFVRRGFRQKLHERVQLYQCKNCGKSFSPYVLTRGKHYPLSTIINAMSLYNLGYSLNQTCRLVTRNEFGRDLALQKSGKFGSDSSSESGEPGSKLKPSTLSTWLSEFENLCRFSRYRDFAIQKFKPEEMVETATLAHRQLFRFRFHRAKCELIMREDIRHHRFGPLKEFLEMVPGECPHHYFQTGLRASETPLTFSKKQMIVRGKTNLANALCTFVLQAVKERKDRHETLQKFMLYNDSVTVATEVPVYITKDDLLHLRTQLGFEMYNKTSAETGVKNLDQSRHGGGPLPKLPEVESKIPADDNPEAVAPTQLPKLITGHIDLLQIRNGQIHILDYKPEAAKVQPIDQLTLYAMALSRLTGLRLFEFKCAWFDEKDFFEFYPLHVLHKTRKGKPRRKIYTWEGVYEINRNEKKIETVRPK